MANNSNKLSDNDIEALLSGISNKELSTLIHETPKINDIHKFVSIFNLQPGEYEIPVGLLHALYKKWSKKPSEIRFFSTHLGQYLPFIKNKNLRIFLINKNTFQITKEQLKEIYKTQPNHTTSTNSIKHFENFLSYYKLAEGEHYVPHFVLFYLYDTRNYKNKSSVKKTRNTIGKENFNKVCNVFFDFKETNIGPQYLVNQSLYSLITPEHYKQLLQGYHKFNAQVTKNHYKKTNPKK